MTWSLFAKIIATILVTVLLGFLGVLEKKKKDRFEVGVLLTFVEFLTLLMIWV